MPCDKTDGAVVSPQLPCQVTTMTPNDELGLSLILSILSLYLDIFVHLPILHVYLSFIRLPVVGLLAKEKWAKVDGETKRSLTNI